jgi:hypothetical protein
MRFVENEIEIMQEITRIEDRRGIDEERGGAYGLIHISVRFLAG